MNIENYEKAGPLIEELKLLKRSRKRIIENEVFSGKIQMIHSQEESEYFDFETCDKKIVNKTRVLIIEYLDNKIETLKKEIEEL